MTPAAVHLNHGKVWQDNGSDMACMLTAPRVSGIFTYTWPEGFSVPEEQMDDNQANCKEIINYPLVIAQEYIPDEDAIWFNTIWDEYGKTVKDLIWIHKNARCEQDAVADELVDFQKWLNVNSPGCGGETGGVQQIGVACLRQYKDWCGAAPG